MEHNVSDKALQGTAERCDHDLEDMVYLVECHLHRLAVQISRLSLWHVSYFVHTDKDTYSDLVLKNTPV